MSVTKRTSTRVALCSSLFSLVFVPAANAELIANSTNTIYDTATGLTWLKQDDGVTRSHTASVGYTQSLNVDGLGCGWRLPNMTELLGIVDTSRTNPAISPLFAGTKSAVYWSSTRDGGSSNWRGVNFLDGSSVNAINDANLNYSRPVAENCLQQTLYYCDGDQDGSYSALVTGTCAGIGCEPIGCTADVNLALDCNDASALIHPGAAEVCGDLVDNDCDGNVDDDGAGSTTWYADYDGDGYGNPALAQPACSKSTGWVTDNSDCNDAEATMFPGNPEICDGKDNNCNGVVDDGLDADLDGDCDAVDNCVVVANPDQFDGDHDGLGDACDACPVDPANDGDADGICGEVDNCPATANGDQRDGDNDGIGDVCDSCPADRDNDSDADGFCADVDNCPAIANPGQEDGDGDAMGDACDVCPADPQNDADGDGMCAGADLCPDDPGKTTDAGVCGCGVAEVDSDGDGTADCVDLCAADPNKITVGICGCGVADGDADNDGAVDCLDGCPADPLKTAPGQCGCGVADLDGDGDGVADCVDLCPSDPLKSEPGLCGCGNADSDGDGVCDDTDECPADGMKSEPGICGCNVADSDGDLDGTVDCLDECPNDANKTNPGVCGCGVDDAIDGDHDGVVDCLDNCVAVGNGDQADCDHDGIGDPCDSNSPCSSDSDLDGVMNNVDNCPDASNPDQRNTDRDLYGDVCDPCPDDANNDSDGDGVCAGIGFNSPKTDDRDNCRVVSNDDQVNSDGDSFGDACDICPDDPANDADQDGLCGDVDTCPSDPDNDGDGDGICGDSDNCPWVANADQANADNDLAGDACDSCVNDAANDADGDGVCGDVDNCPAEGNGDQLDGDDDGIGDVCDSCPADSDNDADDDGVCGDVDECDADPGKSVAGQCGCGVADTDGDGDALADCLDSCPADPANDADGDGVCGDLDNCPAVANADQLNGDGDLFGTVCDPCPADPGNDIDADGICVGSGFAAPKTGDNDNCPATANGNQADGDDDLLGDVCDPCPFDPANDADGDGICGDVDACPNDPANDAADHDGVCADLDNCPTVANADQANADGDGTGDSCDVCPLDPFNDRDGDGLCADADGCPEDGAKSEPGVCGCGVADADSDGDGALDCEDGCPLDPYKNAPGARGCGLVDDVVVPAGSNVAVSPVPELRLVLDQVDSPCLLRTTVAQQSFASSIYLQVGGKAYSLDLQCPQPAMAGVVCLNYDDATVATSERDVRMLRNDQLGLKDITSSLDVDTDWVCGRTTAFTSFAAGEPKDSAGVNPDLTVVPAGTNIAVAAPQDEASLVFPAVAEGGCAMSTFVMSKPVPPPDYRLLGDRALDIDLACSPDGYVCLDYDESDVIGPEGDLVLWHRGVDGWEDITESIDEANNVICGFASSFSPFAVGEPSDYAGIHLIPYPSALSSQEVDRVVSFDASRSSCYEEAYDDLGIMYPVDLNCVMTWDFGGPGTVIGGNGNDVIAFQYDEAGAYTATVSLTESVTGLTMSKAVRAEALLVEPPPRAFDFVTAVNGKGVALTASSIPANIARVYIYWGDRKSTSLTSNPAGALASGVSHSYLSGGSYEIKVVTVDAAWNKLEYTSGQDRDLRVVLP